MISVSTLINVQVTLAASAAQGQDTNDLLLVTNSTVIDIATRYRIYTSLAAVAADFGNNGAEYAAAALWFGQSPQPQRILIGRWAQAAAAGQLVGATLTAAQQLIANFTGVGADGGFSYTVDGGAVVHVVGVNLAAVGNLNAVAAAVTAELAGAATCVWNSVYQRFVFTSATTGAASAVTFLTAAVGGGVTDISALLGCTAASNGCYESNGIAAETALACAEVFETNYGGKWYALVMPNIAADADHIAVTGFINATQRKHFYGITTQEAATLNPNDNTDLAYLLAEAAYHKTAIMYSSSSTVAIVSPLARILTTDYTGTNTVINLAYKQCPGLIGENLNATQLASLEAKNCNVYMQLDNNTSIFWNATTTATNIYIDSVMAADNFAIDLQTAGFNVEYTTTTKIPQDDSGTHQFVAAYQAVCAQYFANGFLGPNNWTNAGFGTLKTGDFLETGSYVYGPPIATQSPASRSSRQCVPIQIAGCQADAFNTASVLVTVIP